MPIGKDRGETKKPEMYILGLTERVERLEQKVQRLTRQAQEGKRGARLRLASIE